MDENPNKQEPSAPTRIVRSRFPKAQPNIGPSSGLARIRHLSGQYTNENEPNSENKSSTTLKEANQNSTNTSENRLPQPLRLQQPKLTSKTTNENKPIDLEPPVVNQNKPIHELTVQTQCKHDDQADDAETVAEHMPTAPLSPTLSMTSSILNTSTKFTKEHIMNIIKHKAMQKLKKIESDHLKEKRKNYQPILELESIDRSKVKMRDLLYYNPKQNHMQKDISELSNHSNDTVQSQLTSLSQSGTTEKSTSELGDNASIQNAPQLKFAEDGSIIINEESLFIKQVHSEPVYDTTVVENEINDNLTYNSYRKFHHTKKWSKKETIKFYKALSMIGTDFTMIQRLFPHRNRDEIKRKFKREERLNQALIDKLLSKTDPMDLSVFVVSDSESDTDACCVNNKTHRRSASCNNENDENTNSCDRKKGSKGTKKPKRIKKRAFVESDEDASVDGRIAKSKPNVMETIERVVRNISEEQERKQNAPLSGRSTPTLVVNEQGTYEACEGHDEHSNSQTENIKSMQMEHLNTDGHQVHDNSQPTASHDHKTENADADHVDIMNCRLMDNMDNLRGNVKDEALEANIENLLNQMNSSSNDDDNDNGFELIFDLDSNSVAIDRSTTSQDGDQHGPSMTTTTTVALQENTNPICFDINVENETKILMKTMNEQEATTYAEDIKQQPMEQVEETNEQPIDSDNECILLDMDSNKRIRTDSCVAHTTMPRQQLIIIPSNDQKSYHVHLLTPKTNPTDTPQSTTFTNSEVRITKAPQVPANNSQNQQHFKQPRLKYLPNLPRPTQPSRPSNTNNASSSSSSQFADKSPRK